MNDYIDTLDACMRDYLTEVGEAATVQELDAVYRKYRIKDGKLKELYAEFITAPVDIKKSIGPAINGAIKLLNDVYEARSHSLKQLDAEQNRILYYRTISYPCYENDWPTVSIKYKHHKNIEY